MVICYEKSQETSMEMAMALWPSLESSLSQQYQHRLSHADTPSCVEHGVKCLPVLSLSFLTVTL